MRHVTAAPQTSAPQHPIGRIPVLDVRPCVDNGARPAKCVVDEEFPVTATVFREGHDAVNASVVLTDPDGVEHLVPMTCTNPGLNTWVAARQRRPHRVVVLPGRGLVRPVRHLGARRDDQGAGRRRHRA